MAQLCDPLTICFGLDLIIRPAYAYFQAYKF